ncbi:hypothetical protein ABIA22_001758 [Sinorhizobium fredii]|uniref:hypothetical protein n=1 Tax=Rhizobium fredii TaxID=380 RepID=UPI003516F7BD
MPSFIELKAVRAQNAPDCYIATIVADIDDNGTHEVVEYGVIPGDHVGIAPEVRAAVIDWKHRALPIEPYTPPTADQLRVWMKTLTRRQLLRVLLEIGITEAAIDAALAGDPVGMIEWKNANSYERLHPLVTGLATDFNLPPEQVDALWAYGLTL